jgi:PIN domain nuclease of toxin-antitoxin system
LVIQKAEGFFMPIDQKKFMADQVKEIEIHKWIESEKAGCDLGDRACLDWIKNHAKAYREYYELVGEHSV